MAASVRIEDIAFSDTRFDVLARLAGLVDADHARGKMLRLWRQCTMEQTHMVSENDVISVLGENGVVALLESRLAARTKRLKLISKNDKNIRICGTEGRIEWLKKLQNNGKYGVLGGRPKKPTRVLKQSHVVSEIPENETPPAPAPALAPALKEEKAPPRDPSTPVPPPQWDDGVTKEPSDLLGLWFFFQGYQIRVPAEEVNTMISALRESGFTTDQIRQEIKRPDRPKGEYPRQLAARMLAGKKQTKLPIGSGPVAMAVRAALDQQKAAMGAENGTENS